MKKTIIKCDKCEIEIKEIINYEYELNILEIFSKKSDCDLCNQCIDKFKNLFNDFNKQLYEFFKR